METGGRGVFQEHQQKLKVGKEGGLSAFFRLRRQKQIGGEDLAGGGREAVFRTDLLTLLIVTTVAEE